MNELPNPAMGKTLGTLVKERHGTHLEKLQVASFCILSDLCLEVIWFVPISDLKSKQGRCPYVSGK